MTPVGTATAVPNSDDLDLAVEELRRQMASFVLAAAGRVLVVEHARGLDPLLRAVKDLRESGVEGAVLADMIVGRAAAMVAAWGRVRAVYGETMSVAAHEELLRQGIVLRAGQLAVQILDRARQGSCPFELAIEHIQSPAEAVRRLESVSARLLLQRASWQDQAGERERQDGG